MAAPAQQSQGHCTRCDTERLLVKAGGHGIPAGAGNTLATIATGGAWLAVIGAKRLAEPAREWRCSTCGEPTAPTGSMQAGAEAWAERMNAKIDARFPEPNRIAPEAAAAVKAHTAENLKANPNRMALPVPPEKMPLFNVPQRYAVVKMRERAKVGDQAGIDHWRARLAELQG